MLEHSPQHRSADSVPSPSGYLELSWKQLRGTIALGAGRGWRSDYKHESDSGVCHSEWIWARGDGTYEWICSQAGCVLVLCL